MPGKAVIVAAGLSSRLYPLTSETPKALLPVGDETLLSRSIRLLRNAGIPEIAVVVGFQAISIRDAVDTDIAILPNPFFRHCNNMGSLLFARDFAADDSFVYLHGDLVYTGSTLDAFLDAARDPGPSCLDLLTAFGDVDEEAMKVRVKGDNTLIESSKAIPHEDAAGEWTGIAVVQKPRVIFDEIERHMMNVGLTDYDTAAFSSLVMAGEVVRCIPANGDAWKEIDTIEDLEAARNTFGGRR
ncbi:MAG: NTP transferase domain-containing protein [Gemmatimonadaceae bacterium]